MESHKPLRLFTLDLQPDEIAASHDRLINDIKAMLEEDVRDELRKLRKKDKKPERVHGKPYTPKDGAFLVELVHPGKRTVTLLFGKTDLYLKALHVSELWFPMEGCNVPIPPSSQLPYCLKCVPSATKKSREFKFHEGIYHLNWSGSYLDLRGGMKQPFFHGAAEKAHDELCNAESLVVAGLDTELQPGMAFFAIFIPECIRFPDVRRWARLQIAPGSVKGVVPPPEHRVLMRSWGTRSDEVYCPNASTEIRRSVDIIKRNPLKHCLLKPETKYEKAASSCVPCKKAVKANQDEPGAQEAAVNVNEGNNAVSEEDEPGAQEAVINVNEDNAVNVEDELGEDDDDALDEEDEVDVETYEFSGHTDEVKSVACHPEQGLLVLSGGADDRGYLWRTWSDNPQDVHELSGHEDTITSVAFSCNGTLLACASMDGTVSVWTTSTGALFTHLRPCSSSSFEWLKWHPRGPALLAGSDDHMLWLWYLGGDPENYLMNVFAGHRRTVTCGDFTPDGKLICSGSDDASLRVWCPKSAQTKCIIEGENFHSTGLTCLAITNDSKSIYSCSKDGSVCVVSIELGQVVGALMGHGSTVCCIGISADGVVATGSRDSMVIIWDAETQEARHHLPHEGIVTCLAWLGATRFVATGCEDGRIRIWDSVSGARRAIFADRHDGRVLALAVSCDRTTIVSAGSDTLALSHNIEFLQLV
ncbi:hypothetical protein ZWY2020_036135 [Hordeum vulgare]|nr:hypothetical protein ZWY2020_036135 [Hordeum vulgare]